MFLIEEKELESAYKFIKRIDFNKNIRIQYLCKHKKIMQQLVPNTNIQKLEKECQVNLKDYFLDYYHNHYDESLQQVARKYILELQKAVVNKRAQKLENKNDDNKIGRLSTFKLNYDITNDYERSCPALICANDKRSFIVFGNFGEAHSTIKNRYGNRIAKLKNYRLLYCYILGRILFTTELLLRQCHFSRDEIINIMNKDKRFSKFYLIPSSSGGRVIRLAKRLIY